MTSSTTTTSSHFNIIINKNITSYHIIINDKIILISILLSITTSPYINIIIDNNIINNHIPHIHTYKISCLRFTLPKSSDNISLIKQQYHSSINDILHPISRKHSFPWKPLCTGVSCYSWVSLILNTCKELALYLQFMVLFVGIVHTYLY